MKTVGLVTEYNPFHNGHLYHIKKAKEVTQADFCVIVMSGDFIQRGAPAITDKYTRTKMALLGGADLVIELPVSYATASAERFAHGAVSLLADTGIVDTLCFGSESGEITPFLTAAAHLTNESGLFVKVLQDGLKSGLSFPAARKQALSLTDKKTAELLQTPNNILGVEYVKALSRLNSSIVPYTIKREGSAYHADTLTGYLDSASAIRKLLLSPEENSAFFETPENSIPKACISLLKEQAEKNAFLCEDDFSQLLFYRLSQESFETLTQYQDMSNDLAKRICNRFAEFSSFQTLQQH